MSSWLPFFQKLLESLSRAGLQRGHIMGSLEIPHEGLLVSRHFDLVTLVALYSPGGTPRLGLHSAEATQPRDLPLRDLGQGWVVFPEHTVLRSLRLDKQYSLECSLPGATLYFVGTRISEGARFAELSLSLPEK